jgi:aspartate/methionine/tyrosine aminotransferase
MQEKQQFSEADRIEQMSRSGIREIMDLAWSMENVNHLEVGEPDFSTPSWVADAAISAIRAGETRYSPNAGIKKLRTRLVEKVQTINNIVCDDSQIVVSSGAVEALFIALTTVLNPGDQILLPNPGWPNFRMMCSLLSVDPVFYSLGREQNFEPDLAQLKTLLNPKVKAILINSPSNPLGVVMSSKKIAEILDFANSSGLWVVSDECYDQITYENDNVSIGSLDDAINVITAFSFSKTYAMTGWRVGYAIVPKSISAAVAKVQEPVISCVNTPAQFAALAALDGEQQIVREMVNEYQTRRDAALAEAKRLGLEVVYPGGAFYLWVNIQKSNQTSREFSLSLLRELSTAVAPGTAFGSNGEGWVRISLASPSDKILRGLQNISELIGK